MSPQRKGARFGRLRALSPRRDREGDKMRLHRRTGSDLVWSGLVSDVEFVGCFFVVVLSFCCLFAVLVFLKSVWKPLSCFSRER